MVVSCSVLMEISESPTGAYDFSEATGQMEHLLKPLERSNGFICWSGFHFKYIGADNAKSCDQCGRWASDLRNSKHIGALFPGLQYDDGFYCAMCRDLDRVKVLPGE